MPVASLPLQHHHGCLRPPATPCRGRVVPAARRAPLHSCSRSLRRLPVRVELCSAPAAQQQAVTRRISIAGAMAAAGGGGAAASSSALSAEAVVQKQLEAYNAHDLEAFMALMDEHCVAKDALTGATIAEGTAALRERYSGRFQTAVHSELLGRLCLGDVVVDREIISGLPSGAAADCLATYLVRNGKIVRMEFVWQARPSH